MTLSIRVSSFRTVRQFDRKYFKVLADLEEFPGGLVVMDRHFRNANRKSERYEGNLESILEDKDMSGYNNNRMLGQVPNGSVYKLTREELDWLQEIQHLINWGQSNSYWIQIGHVPEDGTQGPRCNESDFQLAALEVSAI